MKPYKIILLSIFFLVGVFGTHSANAACNPNTQLCNVQALIQQWSNLRDPGNLNTIITMTPDLKQLHLRVFGPVKVAQFPNQSPDTPSAIASILKSLTLPPNVMVGFHPDNSKTSDPTNVKKWGSEPFWGCPLPPPPGADPTKIYPVATAQCVFQASIKFMNQVNNLVTPTTNQFKIFSIEQSYAEVSATDQGIATATAYQKECLQSGKLNEWCPTEFANPPVNYGTVGPSCEASNLYGSAGYDFGYPQMYNKYPNYTVSPNIVPLPSPYAPTSTPSTSAEVWDANLQGVKGTDYKNPITILPNFLDGTAGTIYQPSFYANGPLKAPDATATILANIISTAYPINQLASTYPCVAPPTAPSTTYQPYPASIYFTVSGEPEFFGNQQSIYTINYILSSTFNQLKNLNNNLQQWPLAIWSFDTICQLPGSGLSCNLSTKSQRSIINARRRIAPNYVRQERYQEIGTETQKKDNNSKNHNLMRE